VAAGSVLGWFGQGTGHNQCMSSRPPSLSPAVQALAEKGVRRSYKKGSVILSEADPGDTLHILMEGSVRVYGADGQGREVTYGQIDAPSYFGEMSLDGGPRSASIEALTACVCLVVTRESVRAQLRECPELADELIHKIIARARSATETVRQMALLDAYGRLRAVLHEIASEPDSQSLRALPANTTHASLAQRIGTSREMVSKILRELEKGGYLVTEGRRMSLARSLPLRW
jgi:CRP/FNR family transcriptional regulator, cyclic AMP receptor protein